MQVADNSSLLRTHGDGVPCFISENDNCSDIATDYFIEFDGAIIPLRHPLVAIILGLVSFTTVLGNSLVVYAVCSRNYFQDTSGSGSHQIFSSSTNFLIVSLAAADLIVGIFVMPLNIFYETTNHVWLFGFVFCDIWHSVDVLASTASIWNLCVISLDRYLALKNPFTYNRTMSAQRTFASIAVVWICASLLSFPSIAWWRLESPDLYVDKWTCIFVDDLSYLFFSSLISFYLPMCVMMFAYWKIYLIAMNTEKAFKTGRKRFTGTIKMVNSGSDSNTSFQLRIHKGRTTPESVASSAKTELEVVQKQSCPAILCQATTMTLFTLPSDAVPCDPALIRLGSPPLRDTLVLLPRSVSNPSPNGSYLDKSQTKLPLLPTHQRKVSKRVSNRISVGKRLSRFSKEKKAAKTLGIVIGCFILCWLPFFIVNVLIGVCKDCVSNPTLVFTAVTWLGHCNSLLNPFIYSFFNVEYRRAFLNILLCGRCKGKRTNNNYYRGTSFRKVSKASSVFVNSPLGSKRGSQLHSFSEVEYSETSIAHDNGYIIDGNEAS